MAKRKIGLLVVYGPELRTFVSGGLLNEILKRGDEPIIFSKFDISTQDFPGLKNVQTRILPKVKPNFFFKLNGVLSSFHLKCLAAKQRNLGFGNFHWSDGLKNESKALDFLMPFFLGFIESFIEAVNFFRNDLSNYTDFIQNTGIDSLIYSGYQSQIEISMLLSARRSGVKLFYVLGNWKDVYISNYHQVLPDLVAYWSSYLYRDALFLNSSISSSKFIISGNPAFYRFKDYYTNRSKHEFLEQYKINSNGKTILWTTSNESLIPNEYLLIDWLLETIDLLKLDFTILLKINAFSNYDFYLNRYISNNQVKVIANYWFRDKISDVTYQSEKGENDWSEILRHVDLIVTAPSTVSLEGMFYNKPIVNFLFDESNLENTKTVSILNTRFYSSILNSKNLILVNDKSQFKALLLDFNTLEFGEVELPSIVEGNNSFNSYSFYSEILNLNNGLCD